MENFENETSKIFQNRFTSVLDVKGDTAVQAASRIGVSAAVITKWRYGRSTPNGEYIRRIDEVYHVPTDYLLGLRDDVPKQDDNSTDTRASELAKVFHDVCLSTVESLGGVEKDSFSQAFTKENVDELFERVANLEKSKTKVKAMCEGARKIVLKQSIRNQFTELKEFLRLLLLDDGTASTEPPSLLSEDDNDCSDTVHP